MAYSNLINDVIVHNIQRTLKDQLKKIVPLKVCEIRQISLTEGRKVVVEDNVFISPNVMTVYSLPDGSKSAETRIGKGAFIGTT